MECIDPCAFPGWDERILRFEGASVFYSSAWARVLAESYGFEPVYFLDDGSDGTAILPMMDIHSPITGRRGVSLPFTDALAGLATSCNAARRVTEATLALGRDRRWRTVQFRGGEPFGAGAKPSSRYRQHSINLRPTEDEMFAALDGSTRRAVRKAESDGVRVTVERGADAIREFCRLNALTRRDHGLPPQPAAFFRNLRRHILDQQIGFVVMGRLEGRPIAAAVFLHFGDAAVFKYGASDRRHQSARANNLVMWHGILACKRVGCRILSMGRTDVSNEGLLRFKRGWGGVESELNYYTYDFRLNTLVTDPERVTGSHNAIFRLLPLPVLRFFGAALYRHIA